MKDPALTAAPEVIVEALSEDELALEAAPTAHSDAAQSPRLSVEDYYERYAQDGKAGQGRVLTNAAPTVIFPKKASELTPSKTWMASRGMTVLTVLRQWSQHEGVQLIWDSDAEFLVIGTLRMQDSYEAAVAALLGQYSEDMLRPVGHLYVDPDSGQRFLVVQAQG